jgi:hypothetical protein
LWIVVLPIALVGGLLLGIVAASMGGAFRASLRPTNWFARLGREAVQLHLRSYRNAHFDGDAPTILELPYAEVGSVAKVVETRTERREDGDVTRRVAYVELRLRHDDTAALESALRAERHRVAPLERGLVGSSRTKHHHYPVTVEAPGRVRVEWSRALLEALAQRLPLDPEERVDLDERYPVDDPESRALAFARRGERVAAVRVLTAHLQMDPAEARVWLAERDAA